jgi:opine dehydrogenase
VENTDLILVTTPANSHREIAEQLAKSVHKETTIILNPGRTFGALEFRNTYRNINHKYEQIVAETQTILYTCRKTGEDSVNIIALKSQIPLSSFGVHTAEKIISKLPYPLRPYFIPAKSMVETSIGNVGMILHCAPLLLNAGWTENSNNSYKYYYDGISPSIGGFIEKIDKERILISKELGFEVESTKSWVERTYHVSGKNLYECIQNNTAYRTIDAPQSLLHRYITEDIACGLVPLEAVGNRLGLKLPNTSLTIDLASSLLNMDFRKTGRNLENIGGIKLLFA